MAGTKISALSALTTVADGDLLPIVDVSDTTQGPGGSTKGVTAANLVTTPVADAIGVARVAPLHDTYVGKATGALVAADSGQTWDHSGGFPLSIIDGTVGNAATGGSPGAGYIDVDMSSRVTRIGARFRYTASGTTNFSNAVVVCWDTSFTTPIPDSPCHLGIQPNKAEYSIWEGAATEILWTHTFAELLVTDDVTEYFVDVILNGDTATVMLPDGTVVTHTDTRIGSLGGNFAGFEIYDGIPDTDHHARFLEVWADAQPITDHAVVPLGAIYRSMGRPADTPPRWELFDEYTTPGTTAGIVLPGDTIAADIITVGGGGGGASGERDAAGTARIGGGGGGAGGMNRTMVYGATLASSITVTVGAGGGGGAAITADTTNGANGTTGGTSQVFVSGTNIAYAFGGTGGFGSATSGLGGGGKPGIEQTSSGGNASASGAAGAAGGTSNCVPTGGGAGGGVTTGNAASAGGAGGICSALSLAGGTSGAIDNAGGAGQAPATTQRQAGWGMGTGGGGGGSSVAGIGRAGGAGGGPGCGGGGGGASVNGQNSGAGGAGSDGYAAIWVQRP